MAEFPESKSNSGTNKHAAGVEPPSLALRRFVTVADVDHVRDIVSATGYFSAAEIGIAVELVEERLNKGPVSGYEFLFLENGSAPVAYACYGEIPCTAGSFDLYWIAVHPSWQGAGLGRMLVAEVERCVRAKKGRRLYAETSGRDQYAATRAFYQCCGFACEAVLGDFYAPGDDKVIFAKSL